MTRDAYRIPGTICEHCGHPAHTLVTRNGYNAIVHTDQQLRPCITPTGQKTSVKHPIKKQGTNDHHRSATR